MSVRKRNPEERRRAMKKYRERHKAKLAEKARVYQLANPDVYRKAAIKYYHRNKQRILAQKYGITLDELAALGDCCQICKSKEKLCIDHCHVSKAVRGLLCERCNHGLGNFKDNSAFLRSALRYLQRGKE